MNIYDQFETDKFHEKKGITLDYGSFSFVIARAGGSNQNYNKVLENLTRPYKRAIEINSIDPDLAKEILMKAYAQSVVLSWKGVCDRSGKEMECTIENCVKIFKDLPDLFDDIQKQSNNATLFRKEILEADLGN